MDKPQKVRKEPRMTAQKLGDYLDARSAAARESILLRQKFPQNFIVARYRDAELAMRAALLSSEASLDHLVRSAERLGRAPTKPGWQTDARDLCVRAIRSFSSLVPKLESKGIRFAPAPADGYHLKFEGVAVSVSPLVRVVRGEGDALRYGLILAVIRKDDRVTKRAGEAIAELLRMALASEGLPVDPKLCIVVDVFGGVKFNPPRSGKRVERDIIAACREIADRWEGLKVA